MNPRFLALAPTLAPLAACLVPLPGEQTSPELLAATDYRIDRTRVVALRFDPPVLQDNETVNIEGLILSPTAFDQVQVRGCGLREDVPSILDSPTCFDVPELVWDIGEGVNVQWDTPHFDAAFWEQCPGAVSTFGDDLCSSTFAVGITAQGEDQIARGATLTRIFIGQEGTRPSPAHLQDLALAAPQTALPGEVIDLGLRFTPNADFLDHITASDPVRWFVDDGELLRTGRTGAHFTADGQILSANHLRIPDDYEGDLRVVAILPIRALVSLDGGFQEYQDLAWRISTIAVSP
ncbi:MAG: hypothetical protein AAFV53_34040 [Myxococcota bacterium]